MVTKRAEIKGDTGEKADNPQYYKGHIGPTSEFTEKNAENAAQAAASQGPKRATIMAFKSSRKRR